MSCNYRHNYTGSEMLIYLVSIPRNQIECDRLQNSQKPYSVFTEALMRGFLSRKVLCYITHSKF